MCGCHKRPAAVPCPSLLVKREVQQAGVTHIAGLAGPSMECGTGPKTGGAACSGEAARVTTEVTSEADMGRAAYLGEVG
jgi:hypothetical protein